MQTSSAESVARSLRSGAGLSTFRKLLLLLVAAFVLVPVPYNVLFGKPPWLPVPVNEFWRFTDLFSQRPVAWPSYHVLFETQLGEWRELPRELVYRDSLFGGMTRLDITLLNFSPSRSDSAETARFKRKVLERICLDFVDAYSKTIERRGSTGDVPAAPDIRLVIGWLPTVDGIPSRRWSSRLVEGQPFDMLYEHRTER